MRKSAYTLLEMVAVMALVAVLTLAATASYHAWGPSTSMRSAENAVLGSLSRARQLAITQSRPVRFCAITETNKLSRPTVSKFALDVADPEDFDFEEDFDDDEKFKAYGPTNDLPRGIVFSNDVFNVTFKADGSCRAPGFDDDIDFAYTLHGKSLVRHLKVNRLTGIARPLTPTEIEDGRE